MFVSFVLRTDQRVLLIVCKIEYGSREAKREAAQVLKHLAEEEASRASALSNDGVADVSVLPPAIQVSLTLLLQLALQHNSTTTTTTTVVGNSTNIFSNPVGYIIKSCWLLLSTTLRQQLFEQLIQQATTTSTTLQQESAVQVIESIVSAFSCVSLRSHASVTSPLLGRFSFQVLIVSSCWC